ncbi:MAG: 2,3-bisphosphoglycerate-dependent phosphoglycerate mutase [Parachlamydiaceae bacterium]|nr:2,3-bisphosphoglycerate-dependent phosphoglycerate mutase [Parachlamydiaceae bacterium]
MAKLIMMRHGQSQWNLLNLFTGWVDVSLSELGIKEALQGGDLIKDVPIDVIFMSSLIRAQTTTMLAMSKHSSGKVPNVIHPGEGKVQEWSTIFNPKAQSQTIPTYVAWELNERMYGELQGLNKQETIEKYGAAQVKLWRRSFDTAPPGGESLAMTAERTLPYFKERILPILQEGKNVFISAHGNSMRAIVMFIENLSKDEVIHLEIATGQPLMYDFQDGKFAAL